MTAVAELLEKMRASRTRVLARLDQATEEQMLTPTTSGQRQVTVRFMFYRLIAHEVEHTVHMVKTFQAMGRTQSEAQLILSRLQATRGELEGLLVGLTDEELDCVAAEGEWSPRQVVEHMLKTEEEIYGKQIDETLSGAPG